LPTHVSRYFDNILYPDGSYYTTGARLRTTPKEVSYIMRCKDEMAKNNVRPGCKKSIIADNAVLNGLRRAIFIYKPVNDCTDFIIEDINDIAAALENLEKSKIIGEKLTDVFPNIKDFGLFDVLVRVYRTGSPEHFDLKEYHDARISGYRENDVVKLDTGEVAAIYDDKSDQMKAEHSLAESEERYRTIIATSIDGFIMIEKDSGRIIEANTSLLNIIGYTKDELLDMLIFDLCDTKQKDKFELTTKALNELRCASFEIECICKNSRKVSVDVSANMSGSDNHIFCFIRDITERKQRETDLFYSSFHDKLTGLYNRAFFEEEIKRLDKPRQQPLSVIMADINGLKFANDAFGHEFGDSLLRNFAATLNLCLRKEDIVARWGGDEFILLLPKTQNSTAAQVCERIKTMSGSVCVGPLNLSVALGISTKEDPEKPIENIIKDAENMMYRNKLLDVKSNRSEAVSSLTKALHELDSETEGHEKRLLEMVKQMGGILDLMPQEIEELKLLSILHDIGKLGVSKDIISKTSRLSPDEWIEMKKHSEIGYRIAESTPGLAHISKYILSVHERWDGKGYPQGLKGNATPKLSRIIAIVDAYDVMVSGRPYKKPMTHNEAKEEIERCSGAQFDPLLAKMFITLDIDHLYK
jgi:diguanylate cyclase (GGDEF)-like protein/PAS domain S-box-containing protein